MHVPLEAPPDPASSAPDRRFSCGSIAVVVALSGLAATLGDTSPTSTTWPDALILGLGVAVVTWLGSRHRGLALGVVIASGFLSFTWIGAVLGIAAATIGYIAVPPRSWGRLINAGLIGLSMNLLARSELGGFLGLSTIFGVALAVLVVVAGLRALPRAQRRAVLGTFAIVMAIAFLSTSAFVVGGLLAEDDLRTANDRTQEALDALRSGEFDVARGMLEEAGDAFDAADARIDNPFSAVVALIPGLAQHARVVTTLTDEVAGSTRDIAAQLEQVDLSALTVSDGRIDVEEVRRLQQPLAAIDASIADLETAIREVDNPWLLGPVTDRLDSLATRVADQRERSGRALAVARSAPSLLGADEPRTYFVGFTTPSEARGLGGFMGNWAEISVDDGQIEMTRFGRADDLNTGGSPSTRRLPDEPGFAEWLARYGPYTIDSESGTTRAVAWKNLNMSPDMTMTGTVIAALYPQSGGRELDGVFVLDVYTLSRLLEFTGPIPLPDGQTVGGTSEITVDNANRFLLNQQYELTENDERIDVLADFSSEVVDRLLTGALPTPDEWIDELGPMIEQGRLTAWMIRADEQAMITDLGWAGTLPVPSGNDAIAVAFNNVAGSKIDYFLRSNAGYEVAADARSGTATATLTLELANEAPDTGQPAYVIDNLVGLPVGSNRTWVSIFSRLPITEVRLDGKPITTQPGFEAGLFVTSAFVVLDSGSSSTLTYEMSGRLDVLDGYTLEFRSPPVVGSLPVAVDARWIDSEGAEQVISPRFERPGLHEVTITTDSVD